MTQKRSLKRALLMILGAGAVLVGQVGETALAAGPFLPPDCSQVIAGRCLNVSYFTGETLVNADGTGQDTVWPASFLYTDSLGTNRTWSLPKSTDAGQAPGVAAQNFVNLVGSYLNANIATCPIVQPDPDTDTTDSCYNYRRKKIGAAFLVLVMTGGKYTAPPDAVLGNDIQTGIADAQDEFPNWSKLLIDEDAAGEIDWNVAMSLPDGHPNSTQVDHAHDVTIYKRSAEDIHAIRIRNKDGDMEINRGCGNMVGDFSSLDDMNMVTGLGGVKDATTGAAVATLTPGGSYTVAPSIQNTGEDNSDTVYLELAVPADVTPTAIDAADGPAGVSSTRSPGGCAPGYPAVPVGTPPTGACTGPHWSWRYNNMAQSPTPYSQTATFTVDAATPRGTSICFQPDVTHKTIADEGDPADYDLGTQQCYAVQAPRAAGLIGDNGDIHAGGGRCGTPQSDGSVTGNGSADAFGQYAVSASGAIGGFGSNGASNLNTLNFGTSGNYQQICRPDLYAFAQANYDAATMPTLSGPINLSTLAGGTYFVNGNATIDGTVSQKTTIVVSGDITIDSPGITLSGGTGVSDLPSLGLIAGGDILINADVMRVDAYLDSDGAINTCYVAGGGIPSPPTCDSTLVVNGFLMGQNLELDRLGPLGCIGSWVGEQVTLNPEIYLNPPQFFDASVDGTQFEGLGESPPLF